MHFLKRFTFTRRYRSDESDNLASPDGGDSLPSSGEVKITGLPSLGAPCWSVPELHLL